VRDPDENNDVKSLESMRERPTAQCSEEKCMGFRLYNLHRQTTLDKVPNEFDTII
jgi:hypothetical protein